MADYVASGDLAFVVQMENFAEKLPTYQTTFGLTAAQLDAVNADRDWLVYVVVRLQQAAAYAEDWTKLKDLVRNGKGGAVIGPFPVAPDITAPPATAILPNVEKRFRAFSRQLKTHNNFATNIGEDLMIIKPKTVFDPATAKPLLKLRIMGALVEVMWVKGPWSSLEIWVRRNGGAWEFLTIDSIPNYIDTAAMPPAGQSQVWEYKGIFRFRDIRVGNWSEVASISVKG